MIHQSRFRLLFAAAIVSCVPSGIAQQSVDSGNPIPTPPNSRVLLQLNLRSESNIALPYRESLPAVVKQCGPHGSPYLWLLGASEMEVIGFTADGFVKFPKWTMTDIPEPSVGTFFVTDSSVSVLVTGLKNAKNETATLLDEDGKEHRRTRRVGEPRQYIARFGTDGTYKGAVELDFPFQAFQIAAFDSGDFLVAGVDAKKIPRVAAVNSSGQLQKFVELEKDITDRPKATSRNFEKGSGAKATPDAIAMFAQFLPYRGNVVLVRSRTNTPVYEIREGGEARAVKIAVPNGFVLDRIIPSDTNNWMFEIVNPVGGGVPEGEHTFIEVSPEDGHLVQQYSMRAPNATLACRHQDEFVAVRRNAGKITVIRGSAEQASDK